MYKKFLRHYAWTCINAPAAKRFKQAMRDPRAAQEQLLQNFLKRNKETLFGKKYDYSSIKNSIEFRERIPQHRYEDLEGPIDALKKGQQKVLSTDKTLFFETSSGSSGPVKYIPYTKPFLNEFRESISTWMYDLFTNRPELMKGSQYWSISPILRAQQVTEANIPIGMSNDSEYLGKYSQRLIAPNLALLSESLTSTNSEGWQKTSINQLMLYKDLRFISVWNPSFLSSLMRYLPKGMSPLDCWPDLKLISCWGDAAAKHFIPELNHLFPGVEVQFKGLLATEGVISIPIFGQPDPVLALTSHVLEFIDEHGQCYMADELSVGKQYKVLLTTGNGFVRYALGDEVEVTSPLCIRFMGRGATISDLCGEKLSESFVQRVFDTCLPVDSFCMLAPQWGEKPCYVLYHQEEQDYILANKVDETLRQSVHYNYCRQLEQLGPIQARHCPDLAQRYHSACLAQGQRPGDIKPRTLIHSIDLAKRIAYEF